MRLNILLVVILAFFGVIQPVAAEQYSPVFDYESVMDTYFDDESGLISFRDYIIGFAPQEPFNGQVAVVNSQNTVVASFKFFPDYALRDGVFARVRIVGPADVTLTEPGIYNLVFLIDGKPVTRYAFALEQTSTGDDPFNPQKTFRFDGLWRAYAHLTTELYKDEPFYKLNLWLGGKDLPDGARKDSFHAELLRDGEVVAHSKRTQGHIAPGHFKRTSITLFHPHDEKSTPNAELFMHDDWLVDGQYVLRITRGSDKAVLRTYDFTVADKKILPLPQTQLNYQPGIDYKMPRVQKKNVTVFGMTETIWIVDRKE